MPYKTDLVAWWSLDEESGARADSHGSNNLTDNNTVLFAAGKKSNAAQFVNANNEYLSVASNADLQTGDIDFTFAFWVYLDNRTTSQVLVAKDNLGVNREYLAMYNQATNRFHAAVWVAGPTYKGQDADTLGEVASTTWYYVIFYHDAAGNTINIQVNNGGVDSLATGGALIAAGAAEFQLGARDGADTLPMDGILDEVGYWKRLLTTDEKTWLYNSGDGRSYSELDSFVPTATTIF